MCSIPFDVAEYCDKRAEDDQDEVAEDSAREDVTLVASSESEVACIEAAEDIERVHIADGSQDSEQEVEEDDRIAARVD